MHWELPGTFGPTPPGTQGNRFDGPHPEASEPGRVLGAERIDRPAAGGERLLTVGNSAGRHRPQVRRIRRPSSAARRFGSRLLVNPTSMTAPHTLRLAKRAPGRRHSDDRASSGSASDRFQTPAFSWGGERRPVGGSVSGDGRASAFASCAESAFGYAMRALTSGDVTV
jgi:hypothetical protein